MDEFDPGRFIEKQVEEIKREVGHEQTVIAVSGGVDSTVCAVLTHLAIGEGLSCILLDDAFMRRDEPETVANLLSKPPLNLPIEVLDVRERFLNAMSGLHDAEEKRKVFREEFYSTLSEAAADRKCEILVQGTILADVIETEGGVKTQHNVLEQIGISPIKRFGFKVIEPLKSILKWQVRMVARQLKVPREIAERQPFPGPGLSVRVVGLMKEDKLETLKDATVIVEKKLARYEPSQYFSAIIENKEETFGELSQIKGAAARSLNVPKHRVEVVNYENKATGVKDGRRHFGRIVSVKGEDEDGRTFYPSLNQIFSLQSKLTGDYPSISRVLYNIDEDREDQPYTLIIRAVQTRDFLTAQVAKLPWEVLVETANEIMDACPTVSRVCYDVTPKPPATIEME